MFPSALVTIRRYPVSGSYGFSGSHAGAGAEERKLLADAGIESYVKLDRIGSVALLVPEAQAATARRVLEGMPDLFRQHLAPPCPRCHTFHPEVRPPYELVPIAIAVLGAGGLAVAGWLGAAYGVVAVGVIMAAVIHSHQPVWRCRSCGFSFGSPRERATL